MPALPDRSTRLMVFGIFQILLGCLCGLMGLMMVFMSACANGPRAAGRGAQCTDDDPGRGFLPWLAVAFVWLGIGSIRARRGLALTVVLLWMWLVMGAAAFPFLVLITGRIMSASAEGGELPPQALIAIQMINDSFVGFVYILLPALFLLFYQRRIDARPARGAIRRFPGLTAAPCRARTEYPLRLWRCACRSAGERLCGAGVRRNSFRCGRRGGNSS